MAPRSLLSVQWPGVTLDAKVFERWLAERSLDLEPMTERRRAELYLACACVHDAPGSHAAFDAAYGPKLKRALARLRYGPSPDDALQQVRLRLFTSTSERRAKLNEFRGEGDLEGWLKTVALRVALAMSGPRREEAGHDMLDRLTEKLPNPELRMLQAERRASIKSAFADAVNALDARQRTVLKMSVLDDLSIDQIAPLYDVHRATVARWLTTIRDELLKQTLQSLQRQLQLSESEAASLLGGYTSELNVSLSNLLKTEK